jgi:hypothetical protein
MNDLPLSDEEAIEAAKLSFRPSFYPDEVELAFEAERVQALSRRILAIAVIVDARKEKEIG